MKMTCLNERRPVTCRLNIILKRLVIEDCLYLLSKNSGVIINMLRKKNTDESEDCIAETQIT